MVERQDAMYPSDRMTFLIVRGVQYLRTKRIIDEIASIPDLEERLVANRQKQWEKRYELAETVDISTNYRHVIQTIGILEKMEEEMTGKSNENWFIWPKVKKMETEAGGTK